MLRARYDRSPLLLALLFGVAACNPGEPVDRSGTNAADLTAASWQLTAFENADGRALKLRPGEAYSITFQPDAALAGVADCNLFFGTYEASDGGRIAMEPRGMTYVGCPDESHWEPFLEAIGAAHAYVISGERLHLRFGASGLLSFVAIRPGRP